MPNVSKGATGTIFLQLLVCRGQENLPTPSGRSILKHRGWWWCWEKDEKFKSSMVTLTTEVISGCRSFWNGQTFLKAFIAYIMDRHLSIASRRCIAWRLLVGNTSRCRRSNAMQWSINRPNDSAIHSSCQKIFTLSVLMVTLEYTFFHLFLPQKLRIKQVYKLKT